MKQIKQWLRKNYKKREIEQNKAVMESNLLWKSTNDFMSVSIRPLTNSRRLAKLPFLIDSSANKY